MARADLVPDSPDVAPAADARVGASVDLGSNSVHLLVASVAGHVLTPLDDESVFLGLGSTVARRGHLGRAGRAELVAVLERYATIARRLGAAQITFLGTEPIRRSADAAVIVHDVRIATGMPLHVLSHEEEAYLTIVGVMAGLEVTHETLVIDIGGGSSEFCVVKPDEPPRASGLRLGSARVTDQFVIHDPPQPPDVEAMYNAATEALTGAPPANPAEIIAVGGTASNLRKVILSASDAVLRQEHIAEAMILLASMPAADASERYGINAIRARILPAGAAILAAILDHYGVAEVRVSEAGIREGAVLAITHAGPGWRDRLVELTGGWRT